MSSETKSKSYSPLSRIIHWTSALLILGLLGLGFYMETLDRGPFKLEMFGLHKSFGLIVLALLIIRIYARIVRQFPPALSSHTKIERILSKSVKHLLYLSLLIMPLSGWIMSSAEGYPVKFFGLFTMPDLVGKNENLGEFMEEIHEISAFILIGALALHMAGAFKHHFIDRDETLQRMTFARLGLIGGALLALIFGALWLTPVGLIVFDSGSEYKEDHDKSDHDDDEKEDDDTEEPHALNDNITEKDSWIIDKEKSTIRFTTNQEGASFTGEFANFDGDIIFNPDALDQARVDIRIFLKTLKSGNADRDIMAQGQEWLATAQYPVGRFRSDHITKLDAPNLYKVEGDFTLRNITRPLSFPFTLDIHQNETGQREASMSAQFTFDRFDYEVGQGEWRDIIDPALHVSVNIVATMT